MSDEISQAFGPLAERSQALSGDHPADRIALRDHLESVEIGAFQEERGTHQRLRFNIVVEVRNPADIADDVDRILSYDTLTDAIAAELAAERLNLLETLAERIAAYILREPAAERVFVRIEKLDRGPGSLGVEILRTASDALPLSQAARVQEGPDPLVVYLSDAATGSAQLPAWLDQLEAQPRPVILCCGPAAHSHAAHPLVQRRIDLLAIEQNAWLLAARDRHCVVVASRTELDYAMKTWQICLWAPSKIVLDAAGDRPERIDGAALALWLAGLLGASDMLVLGGALPAPEGATRLIPADPETEHLPLP